MKYKFSNNRPSTTQKVQLSDATKKILFNGDCSPFSKGSSPSNWKSGAQEPSVQYFAEMTEKQNTKTCSSLSSNSDESQCYEKYQNSFSNKKNENIDSYTDKYSKSFKFDDFDTLLPLDVYGFIIRKLTWDDFKSTPDIESQWKAHTFWSVSYSFVVKIRKNNKTYNPKYKLQVNAWTILNEKCWVKLRIPRLLEHETGHYLIGCLCALDFKERAEKQRFTRNFKFEIQSLFNAVYREYIKLEKKYDEQTDHSREVDTQKKWNVFFRKQLIHHYVRSKQTLNQ